MLESKTVPNNEQPTNDLRWANSPERQSSSQSGMGLRREGFLEEATLKFSLKGTVSEPRGGNEIYKAHRKGQVIMLVSIKEFPWSLH